MKNRIKNLIIIIQALIIVAFASVVLIKYRNTKEEEKQIQIQMEKSNNSIPVKKAYNMYANANIKVNVIASSNNTYGYDILLFDKILIHQPCIPGIPGNEGFKKRDFALKVGKLVEEKLRNNIFPPTIMLNELDSLKVL